MIASPWLRRSSKQSRRRGVSYRSHGGKRALGHANKRFVPKDGDAAQQATWRAERQERSYRREGNSIVPAMPPHIAMGRWYAYAHIQRAGIARQDIVELRHKN